MSKQPPNKPKKEPYKGILPSSQYYTTEEENEKEKNLTNEDLEDVKEVNLTALVEAVKKHPGSKAVPFSLSNLNIKVPKMKLPTGLKGGKKTRRKRKGSRKH